VDSAAPTWAMWDLSRLVRRSPALSAEFDAGVNGLLDRVRAPDDEDARTFLDRFDSFLYEFGSRCSNEYELAELSWESSPNVPLTFIDRMRLQDEGASPQAGFERLKADREKVTAEMLDALRDDPEARGRLEAGLKAASVFLPARERSKTALIRLLHEARMSLQEMGRRMVADGHFEYMGDFTFLRSDEVADFLGDPASWSDEVTRRRRWVEALAELEPPFITVGMPSPPSTWRRRTVENLPAATAGEVIAGIGVCAGAATGTARVIRDPADGGDLQPGDVLIAPLTDPMWTPLFISAAAVVVDVGAPLSHAAIVSRELGIPCVVSAPHASRRIPNGAKITVDGTTGTVTIHAT
jgi:phosphohistidine swiveling domain-containing protein